MDRLPDLIEGREIRLRRAGPADAAILFALFNNWNVIRWLARPPWPVPLDEVEAYLKQVNRDPLGDHYWAIERKGGVMGGISVGIAPASDHQSGEGPHIGYWLGEPYWGRGLMSEAARLLCAALFSALPDSTIYSGFFEGNEGSLRIQQKLGFDIESRGPMYSTPLGKELPHVSTILTRVAFDERAKA